MIAGSAKAAQGAESLPPAQTLDASLAHLRRRVLCLGGAAGLAWACLVAIAVWLALAWLDLVWELSPQLRIAVSAAALLAGLGALAVAWAQALAASRGPALVRRLDAAGGAGGEIVSGFDLAAYPQPADGQLTRLLAAIAVRRRACWPQT